MTQEEILKEFNSLPAEGQRQVADFIAFLRERYSRSPNNNEPEISNLAQDSFIGMWQDREDMQDSHGWIRNLREHEWINK
jgi:hypothetical protein